jgi:hypothetical protein
MLFYLAFPNLLFGQYTYFNNSYQPLFPEIGSGDVGSLTLSGDSLVAYSCTPVPGGAARRITVIGPDGGLVRDEWMPIENNMVHVVDYSDTVYPLEEGGYCWSGTAGGVWPVILWMDEEYTILRSVEYPELFDDTTWSSVFQSAQMGNGDIVSSGRIAHIYGPMPGQMYANLLLMRHDAQGNEIFMREYTLEDLSITIDYSGPQAFPRGAVFELSNGDILLFGSIGGPLDCYAIKFDSEGNYLDHVRWGHLQYGAGSPWPVQIGVDEFAFGYSAFAYLDNSGYIFNRPRIGWLSASTMDLFLGNFFDHPIWYGGVTDMERAPDGGFVMLGKGKVDLTDTPGEAYLLKLDSLGNEEWYYTYVPPESDYHTESAYDLEMTPDGGMAFVGNYFSYEAENYVTWIVKTDACGELQFNGCAPQVGVEETANAISELKVFPNPANSHIHINWSGSADRIEMLNALGQMIGQVNVASQSNSATFDISMHAPGCYVLIIRGQNEEILGTTRAVRDVD